MGGSLAPDAVVPRLRGRFGRPYRYEPETASTQRLLDASLPEGAVAVADHQTAGRGRLGRVWESDPGTSLLVSVLLRPNVPAARLPALSVVTAEAVAEAVAAAGGVAATVKHPNDVLVAGRKVAGILGEAKEGAVVLGIGVNVNTPPDRLPASARLPATSLLAAAGHPVDRAVLLVELLARLEARYTDWLWREPGATALVVPVPEAEPLIADWRRAYTASGAEDVEAHVTVLLPFVRGHALGAETMADVARISASHPPFPFQLARTARWPALLYLPPEPAEPFVRLVESFAAAFPDHPPYGGRHDTVVPHVTVAGADEDAVLDRIADHLGPRLPVRARATELALLERAQDGRFRLRASFPLGTLERP